jgi:hypothetical protein
MRHHVLLTLTLLAAPFCVAQPNKLNEVLARNRYPLTVAGARLSGPGSGVLAKALSEARFVLIGEDHGTAEVPHFVEAVWEICVPLGFRTMAVESGPLAVEQLRACVGREQGRACVAALEKQFPWSIAFYNLEQEFDLLSRCAAAVPQGRFRLWGLDQEFFGSARLILTRMLETRLTAPARRAIERCLEANDRAYSKALQTGNSKDLFLLAAFDAQLDELKDRLDREGNPAAQSLMRSLLKTRGIYRRIFSGDVYESNRERSMLMKANFVREYQAATRVEGQAPKVLLKFGLYHAYKGFNPLNNNDLGNYVAELAEGQSAKSLHIAIVPVRASELQLVGVGKPYEPRTVDYLNDKNSPLGFLKPLYENLESGGWTLFDLRGLRANFRGLGAVAPELRRLIFGYDLAVVYPQGTPSRQIR